MATSAPPRTAMTDVALVRAARQGDASALDALVTRYEPRVYRFAFRLTGHADEAAEVAQDTLLAMARSIDTFRGESSLNTWLYAVARRLALRLMKQRVRRRERETALETLDAERLARLASPLPTPEQSTSAGERDAIVNAALGRLSPVHRDVLVLRDIEGLTAPEAARVLGVGVRAVKSRLHRARLQLRQDLAPAIGSGEPPRQKPGCRHRLEAFSKVLEGELAPKTCDELEQHLRNCPGCRALCDSLEKVLAACRRMPKPDRRAELRRSLKAAIRRARTADT